ncbi:hypothetical protein L218DRAFT_1006402 [Marasmius fiardii PR-910]|nr:hypothetical protein L218DRAFT_1006402 [Marasmius fiardii PR-910]
MPSGGDNLSQDPLLHRHPSDKAVSAGCTIPPRLRHSAHQDPTLNEEESEQEKTDCSTLPHAYDVTNNKHVHLTTDREWASCDQNQCPNALANSISEPHNLTDNDGSVLEFDRFIPVLPPLPPSPLPVHPVTPSLPRTPGHSRPGSHVGQYSRPISNPALCTSPTASPAPAPLPVPRYRASYIDYTV